MEGREVGVLPDRGKADTCCLAPPLEDCDIRRVLMTHMGLVTTVLLAPAKMDDQKLMASWLCTGAAGGQRARKQPGGRGRSD